MPMMSFASLSNFAQNPEKSFQEIVWATIKLQKTQMLIIFPFYVAFIPTFFNADGCCHEAPITITIEALLLSYYTPFDKSKHTYFLQNNARYATNNLTDSFEDTPGPRWKIAVGAGLWITSNRSPSVGCRARVCCIVGALP
jgi:hypothetical protein